MRLYIKLAALALAVGLAGCTTAPILNVSEAPAISASGKPLSRDQVRGAIVRAGASLGWQMKDEGPNMLVGTIHVAQPYGRGGDSLLGQQLQRQIPLQHQPERSATATSTRTTTAGSRT